MTQGKQIHKINIQFEQGQIKVDPYTVEARLGDVLQFDVSASAENIVYVGGKEWDGVWITGHSTRGTDSFDVLVDPDLDIPDPPGQKEYEYFVVVPRVGYLDPEVIVKK